MIRTAFFIATLFYFICLAFAASGYPGAGNYYPGGGGSGSYPGATGPAYNPGAGTPGPAVSCPDSLNNANRAFDQLVNDLKKQAPQWSVFSDFDAVNEVSYFLKTSCNTTQLQLVRVGPPSAVPSEEEACDELQAILENLLEENNSSDFRGGFEGSIDTSKKGLELGKQVGDNCQFRLVQLNDTNITNATNTAEPTETPETADTPDTAPSDAVPALEPEPVPVPGPESTLPPQDDANSNAPSSPVRLSFRVIPVSVLNSDSETSEEEEAFFDNGEWSNEKWITKAWDGEQWATESSQNEEWSFRGWKNGDWSDWASHFGSGDHHWQAPDSDSSDSHWRSTFLYQVNPNGNTDSGSDWMNGGYTRYIPPGSAGNAGSSGNSGIPTIPSIPGNPGNTASALTGGTKTTMFLVTKQEKDNTDNPWMSGDYKRYFGGNEGNGGPQQGNFLYRAI